MGKMLMIVVAGLGIMFSFAGLQRNQSTARMTDNASINWENGQSKNIAKSGIDMAIMHLAQDPHWDRGIVSNTGGNGRLNVSVEPTASRYPDGADEGLTDAHLITSIADVNGESHQVQAVVQFAVAEATAPPALAYGIMSEQKLHISGNVNIGDDGNPSWNANVHTNSNINMNGTNLVEGYGTYSGSISCSPAKHMNSTFQPNVPDGGPVQYQAPNVPVPDVDLVALEAMATVNMASGRTVSGKTTLGTKENPHIYFIHGNLRLSGQMSGYGIFIVDGDIDITGNITLSAGDADGTSLGIISTGDIKIAGNTEVHASILAKGDVRCGGNSEIHGGIVTGGTLKFHGTTDILYRPVGASIAAKVWRGEFGRPNILSYYE